MNQDSHRHGGTVLKILVAPDSFKGSLQACEVAAHIAAGLRLALPGSDITEAPIADGGEGTADTVALALGGAWHAATVVDANGEAIDARYAVCDSPELGTFAILDVAEIVGLPAAVVPAAARSTRGIGQAIRAIAQAGYKTIVLGLGGSSTNDAGAGLLSELAFHFRDAAGTALDPVFGNLADIKSIERRQDSEWLRGIRLIGLTDVDSPLAGPNGASMIFGGQKGFEDLPAADVVLSNFGKQCEAFLDSSFAETEGAGAAGGLGFALCALGGKLLPGASFILEALRLKQELAHFDWIITGEGRSDRQTLLGKGPALVARLARDAGVPVTLLSGAIEHGPDLEAGFDGCFSVQSAPVTLDYAMRNAGMLLEAASRQLATLFASAISAGVNKSGR
jgi:glycerate kinase